MQNAQNLQKERHIMQRKASAVWQGDLKGGKGTISTDSGVLKQTQYSFSTRFENGVGTNPEELLAAAHAGCFTMALSAQLGGAGLTAQKLETTATVTLDKVGDGFSITKSHLDLIASVPGADKATLQGRNFGHRPAGVLRSRTFSLTPPNEYNAAHDSFSRRIHRGRGDLPGRRLGRV
jgi:osmotically inducible protein OsmC